MNGLSINNTHKQGSKKGKKSNHLGEKNSYSFDRFNQTSTSGAKLNSFDYMNNTNGNNPFYDPDIK